MVARAVLSKFRDEAVSGKQLSSPVKVYAFKL